MSEHIKIKAADLGTLENILPLVREAHDKNEDLGLESALGQKFEAELTTSNGSKKVFTLIPVALVPLSQNLRNRAKEAATGVIMQLFVGGVESYPVQYGGYAGGVHLDMVNPNGNLMPLCRWGWNQQLGKQDEPKYQNSCTVDFAALAFEVAATVLDTPEGIEFKASLKDPEVIAKAGADRPERPGFKRILAQNSDHYATSRRSSDPESYLLVSESRKNERQERSATRTVSAALPF